MAEQNPDTRNQTGEASIDRAQPEGDLGHRGKTWSPPDGEQGISNRADDEDEEEGEGEDEFEEDEKFDEEDEGEANE